LQCPDQFLIYYDCETQHDLSSYCPVRNGEASGPDFIAENVLGGDESTSEAYINTATYATNYSSRFVQFGLWASKTFADAVHVGNPNLKDIPETDLLEGWKNTSILIAASKGFELMGDGKEYREKVMKDMYATPIDELKGYSAWEQTAYGIVSGGIYDIVQWVVANPTKVDGPVVGVHYGFNFNYNADDILKMNIDFQKKAVEKKRKLLLQPGCYGIPPGGGAGDCELIGQVCSECGQCAQGTGWSCQMDSCPSGPSPPSPSPGPTPHSRFQPECYSHCKHCVDYNFPGRYYNSTFCLWSDWSKDYWPSILYCQAECISPGTSRQLLASATDTKSCSDACRCGGPIGNPPACDQD
jgi:hypothetical protein